MEVFLLITMKHVGTQTVIAPPDGTKIGQLRVWWSYGDAAGRHMDYYSVEDLKEAKKLLKKLADKQVNDASIDFNSGGLEVWEERMDFKDNGLGPRVKVTIQEWTEWMDDDGNDIDAIMENEETP
jgi:hypothetical protein